MIRSPIALPDSSSRLHKLTEPLRVFCLGRPGLITRVLAIVAFFSIGIV